MVYNGINIFFSYTFITMHLTACRKYSQSNKKKWEKKMCNIISVLQPPVYNFLHLCVYSMTHPHILFLLNFVIDIISLNINTWESNSINVSCQTCIK